MFLRGGRKGVQLQELEEGGQDLQARSYGWLVE